MPKSILKNEKECYFCDSIYGLHRHHVFFGTGNRRISEKFGCWVWLCRFHHQDSQCGVHWTDPEIHLIGEEHDRLLKEECQKAWETKHGSRELFIQTFGRSWL